MEQPNQPYQQIEHMQGSLHISLSSGSSVVGLTPFTDVSSSVGSSVASTLSSPPTMTPPELPLPLPAAASVPSSNTNGTGTATSLDAHPHADLEGMSPHVSGATNEIDLLAYHDPVPAASTSVNGAVIAEAAPLLSTVSDSPPALPVEILSPTLSPEAQTLLAHPPHINVLTPTMDGIREAVSEPQPAAGGSVHHLAVASSRAKSTKSTVGRFEVLDQEGSPASRTPGSARSSEPTPVPFPSPVSDTLSPAMNDISPANGGGHLSSILEEHTPVPGSSSSGIQEYTTNGGTSTTHKKQPHPSDDSSSDDDSSTGSTRSPSPINSSSLVTPPPSALQLPMSPPQDPAASLRSQPRMTKSGRFSVIEFRDDLSTSPAPGGTSVGSASASPPVISSISPVASTSNPSISPVGSQTGGRQGLLDTLAVLQSDAIGLLDENDFLRHEVVQLVSHVFLLRSRLESALLGQLAIDVAQDTLKLTELSQPLVAFMTKMTREAKQAQMKGMNAAAAGMPQGQGASAVNAGDPASARSLQPSLTQQNQSHSTATTIPVRFNSNITPSPAVVSKFFADQVLNASSSDGATTHAHKPHHHTGHHGHHSMQHPQKQHHPNAPQQQHQPDRPGSASPLAHGHHHHHQHQQQHDPPTPGGSKRAQHARPKQIQTTHPNHGQQTSLAATHPPANSTTGTVGAPVQAHHGQSSQHHLQHPPPASSGQVQGQALHPNGLRASPSPSPRHSPSPRTPARKGHGGGHHGSSHPTGVATTTGHHGQVANGAHGQGTHGTGLTHSHSSEGLKRKVSGDAPTPQANHDHARDHALQQPRSGSPASSAALSSAAPPTPPRRKLQANQPPPAHATGFGASNAGMQSQNNSKPPMGQQAKSLPQHASTPQHGTGRGPGLASAAPTNKPGTAPSQSPDLLEQAMQASVNAI